jgi:hypothetical protein
VPNICPDTPALRRNPVFMYFEDGFKKPAPFSPDVVVPIDDTIEKKFDMLDAHVSQFYEWLPWHAGKLDEVPKDAAARRAWLKTQRFGSISADVRAALVKRLGEQKGAAVKYAEAFELCEYGRRPDQVDLARMFPFLQ